MAILVNTQHRSSAVEWMDDFETQGDELNKTLDQLAAINRWLGGNGITRSGIKKLIGQRRSDKSIHVIDFGCGNGDMLRFLAKWARKQQLKMTFCGFDANEAAINYAIELSSTYPEIDYLHRDIFAMNNQEMQCDVALSTLFLHHFKTDEIISLLARVVAHCRIGIVINDLHRHRGAYYLFTGLCLFIRNKRIKEDGLISILKGFKKRELYSLSKQLDVRPQIKWKWAFRYQWIIQK